MRIFKNLISTFIFLTFFNCSDKSPVLQDNYLISNISVVDPVEGLKENIDILISGNRIQKISNYQSNKKLKIRVIDGTGKFIIPGLWDSHVHFSFNEKIAGSMSDLFLAHGVTSVRDTGGPLDIIMPHRDSADVKINDAPRVMIAGPLIDGTPNVYNNSSLSFPNLSIENLNNTDIEKNVLDLIDKKVDFLKAYEMLNKEQFLIVTKIGLKNKLNITGHIPLSMDLFSAVEGGLNGMEHLRNFEMSVANNSEELLLERLKLLKNTDNLEGSQLRSLIHQQQRMSAIKSIDENKFLKAAKLLAKNKVWQTPTLILYRNFTMKSFKDSSFEEQLKKIPDDVAETWRNEIAKMDTIIYPSSLEYSKWMIETVGKLNEYNVPFLAGTDTPIGYLIPGRSLHRELELFVKSGFSSLDALKTATINPAIYFGLENEIGRVKEGYEADLVILNDNPISKISSTQKINAVIKSGKYFDRKSLDFLMYK